MKNILYYLFLLAMLSSCGSSTQKKDAVHSDNIIRYAKGISIIPREGYSEVNVANPWKQGALLQKYILVPRDSAVPENLPEGTIVRTPLKKALIYSSVHTGAMKDIVGNYNSLGGVCDASYFADSTILSMVKNGKVTDCGSSMAPTIEKIIELSPDAILLSPFQNSGYGQLPSLKIPLIECADYMESSPLGRAEWIKFFGLLFGNLSKSESMFKTTESAYNSLKSMVDKVSDRPKVVTENIINGIWYIPGGDSYMSHILQDAGGSYPWSNDKNTGSLQFDFSQVFEKAHDAKFWLLKTFKDETLESVRESYALNAKMDAFKNNGIYSCNTQTTTLFNDFPFHPDMLLKEYIAIFHPQLLPNYKLKYYKLVK